MSEWQPIETAPKDGTEIIGYRQDAGIMIVRFMCAADFLTDSEMEAMDEDSQFQEDWWYADFVSGGRLEGTEIPTHWMPLPEHPK